MRFKAAMRVPILVIVLGACTRADETPKPPPPAPPPAVRPVVNNTPELDAELAKLAKQLVGVTKVSAVGCIFGVSRGHDLTSKSQIPLDKVTWKLDANHGQRPLALATCAPHGECIWAVSESRTTGTPHVYSRDHHQIEWDKLVIADGVADPAKLVAELNRAKRFCKPR